MRDCLSIIEEFKKNQNNIEKSIELADKITDKLKNYKLAVYPAGVNGHLIQETLLQYNIRVDKFFDKNYNKIVQVNGVKVLAPDEIEQCDDNTILLICANLRTRYDFFFENAKKINPNIKILNGEMLNRMLKYSNCFNKFKNNKQINLYECEHCGFEKQYCPIATMSLKKFANHKELPNDTRSDKFDWFGYIVSQTCTLKCKHCCEQVALLNDKGFTPVEELVKDVKKLAESTKWLIFVELIGGEPFLHPNIEELITELLKIENIGYIKSFTNATVVPSDELCEIMKNPRFMLHMSNYENILSGKLLENIHKTREKLKEKGVNYLFTPNFEWLDFTGYELNPNQTDEQSLKKAFNDCFISNCNRVYKGVLYRCPHQYSGIQLGKLKKLPIECIDIHTMDKEELSAKLQEFAQLDYIDACKYCKLPYDAKPVPAGEQLGEKVHA